MKGIALWSTACALFLVGCAQDVGADDDVGQAESAVQGTPCSQQLEVGCVVQLEWREQGPGGDSRRDTSFPSASAGRITAVTTSARAARNRKSSATGEAGWSSSRARRAASATGVPPGSRTATQGIPASRSFTPSRAATLDFPVPSGPSRTTNRPRLRALTRG